MIEIVAEISGNHGGNPNRACDLIYEAAGAGCDYAKFQYYRPEDMPDRHEGDNDAMYRKLMVPDEWLPTLFDCAKWNCIGLFASVFSVRAVHELLKYDVPYIKLASPDSTPLPLETVDAIIDAVPADVEIIASGRHGLDFSFLPKALYCPLGHPPTITEVDFSEFRRHNFWGFSDHTPGVRTPLAFIRAGAEMIEKHLKLDDDCVDAAFSADPQTMKLLCRLAHNT